VGAGPVITIDGPAGAGKSTVSRILAGELSFYYLDTGALYRALAYGAMIRQLSPEQCGAMEDLCGALGLELRPSGQEFRIYVLGEDVTEKLRTESIGFRASVISASENVRKALLPLQRKVVEKGGIVAEGRDMGTVVFPDAEFKFFLTADLSERAKRRFREIEEKEDAVAYEKVKENIMKRDGQDTGRRIAPLRVPEGAAVIDTTDLDIGEVIEKIKSVIRTKGREYSHED